jgi:hypothetical protein
MKKTKRVTSHLIPYLLKERSLFFFCSDVQIMQNVILGGTLFLEMEVEANNPQQKISFDTIITVFLRTFLATFGGAVGAYLLVAAGHYLRIPKGIVHSKVK